MTTVAPTPLAAAVEKLTAIRDQAAASALSTYRTCANIVVAGKKLTDKQTADLAAALDAMKLTPTDFTADVDAVNTYETYRTRHAEHSEADFIAAQAAAKENVERLDRELKEARSEQVMATHRYTGWCQMGNFVAECRTKAARVLGPTT